MLKGRQAGNFFSLLRHKTLAGKNAENYFEKSVVKLILCMEKKNRL